MLRLRAAVTVAAVLMTTPVHAADLHVIAAGAVRGILGGMIEEYSRQTGVKVTFTAGPTGLLRDTINAGKPADLVITSAPLMAELETSGKIVTGSRTDLGRVGMGVVVRAGTPEPDISTPAAVKSALVKAQSIAFTDPKLGGTSVLYLLDLAEQFGIKDAVAAKGVTATGGNDAAAKVADGKADIAIVPITDIHAKNAKLVGPVPEPIQLWTVYAAAIPRSSTDPGAARAFLAALTGPAMRNRWTEAGWQLVK
jgi:molybdate transport system substrate-binding protein